jgi:uncharacterized membrane protein YcaP (DUF421 family)
MFLEERLETPLVVPLQINKFTTSDIFLFMLVISFFVLLSFFTLLFHQVLGSTIGDTASGSAVDQQVQHLRHFFFVHISHFSIVVFFTLLFHQVLGSIVGDTDDSAVNQQVQHLNHFCVHVSHFLFFYICHFCYIAFPSGS